MTPSTVTPRAEPTATFGRRSPRVGSRESPPPVEVVVTAGVSRVGARALLRSTVGQWYGVPPGAVEIDRRCTACGGAHGRPAVSTVAGRAPPEPLGLSVAHSGQLTVVALHRHPIVGIDLERVGGHPEADDALVEYTLTAAEQRYLLASPPAARATGFLQLWTGKEAVLKALGVGLGVEPAAVHLPRLPPGGWATVRAPGGRLEELWVQPLGVAPGYVCTLATSTPHPEVAVLGEFGAHGQLTEIP